MYLLKDNKIVIVDITESKGEILATKTREQLLESWNKPESIVKDVIYSLKMLEDYGKGEYCFRVIQSQYNDNSGINNGHGVHKSKGKAIMDMLENGFKVTIDGIEITKPI